MCPFVTRATISTTELPQCGGADSASMLGTVLDSQAEVLGLQLLPRPKPVPPRATHNGKPNDGEHEPGQES